MTCLLVKCLSGVVFCGWIGNSGDRTNEVSAMTDSTRGETIGSITTSVRFRCVNYLLGADFFHHNEDSTMYKRNLCYICQNPNIVVEKSRTTT